MDVGLLWRLVPRGTEVTRGIVAQEATLGKRSHRIGGN